MSKYKTCVICGKNLQNIETNFNGSEWVCPHHTETEWEQWCIIAEYLDQITIQDFENNFEVSSFKTELYYNTNIKNTDLVFLGFNGYAIGSHMKKIYRFPNDQDRINSEFETREEFLDECFEEFRGKKEEIIHNFFNQEL